ncbi:glycosyltransferase family 4 protein [archaeon]|nr:glycosyltransferase family 4 protein [archaeon]
MSRGHTSDVACLNTCAYASEKLPARDIFEGINIYRLPYSNLKYYKIAPSVLKFAKNYDVIHIHGVGFFSDYFSLTKWLHGKPLVLSTHGGIFHTKNLSVLKKFYFFGWFRLVSSGISKIFAHSKNDLELFSKISKNKCAYVPYSIRYDFFDIARKPEKSTLLFVGRISENKRVDNLVKCAAEARKKIPGIKLFVVGGDWGRQKEAQAIAKSLGVEKNVFFEGEKHGKELLEYYKKSGIFVLASSYEGFGISAIEAMAAGCIPVLNDIQAFRAFINDGKNGFIVDFSDAKKAAERIIEINNLPLNIRNRIEAAAKKTAKEYDWAKTAGDIESFYGELI